ncbi:MAG: L-histidine N(alpha)-methyltransferase [Methylococcaceae bacterium]|nr:L-histidine N(alpha)-methyltransferase [Methylococcaceae bacterium]
MNLHFHNFQPESEDLHASVVQGLMRTPKQLHPKLFYDEIGSQIFERICEQPEYYLPEVERGIFETHAREMIACLGENCHIIEPGAGSSKKIRFLLDRIRPSLYAPMDISAEHLLTSAQKLARDYPVLPIHAICVDHTKPYRLPAEIPGHNRVFFYPGSSLGNFDPVDAIHFLRDIRGKAGEDGGLMIGIDTKKPPEILNRAYNDAAGATAAFNLNLLQRIKSELDADVDVESFYHHAFYNERLGRIEMHLYSRCKQKIRVNGSAFQIEAGESIHTENSYKYTVEEFQALAREAGWKSDRVWLDDKQYFSVHFLRSC